MIMTAINVLVILSTCHVKVMSIVIKSSFDVQAHFHWGEDNTKGKYKKKTRRCLRQWINVKRWSKEKPVKNDFFII